MRQLSLPGMSAIRGLALIAAITAVGLVFTCTAPSASGRAAATVKVGLATGGDPTKLTRSVGVTKAGKVTFVVHNYSNLPHKSYGVPDAPEGHELVVLKTNLAPNKLRVDHKNGDTAIETGRIGRPLVLEPGKEGTVTLTLKPGRYVLICNLYGHYAAGQYASFKVVP